ncbi:MAG: M56 family metallopeptidase [Gemmatimonadota bacterium]
MAALNVSFAPIGWALLHLTWQFSLVAAMLRLGQRIAGDPPPAVRYSLMLGAMFTAPVLLVATALVTSALAAAGDGGAAEAASSAASVLHATSPPNALDLLASGAPLLGIVWATWMLVLLVRWSGGLWLLNRTVGPRSRPAGREHGQMVAVLARHMGVDRPVRLRVSKDVDSPCVVGHRRATLLVSESFLNSAHPDELRAVMAHELAHVRRGDFLHRAAQTLIRSAFGFHPAVRWMSDELDVRREQACDDIAAATVADRRRYAAALARLAILRGSAHALAPAADGAPLLDRVRRLKNPPPAGFSPSSRRRIAAAMALCALVLSLTAAGALPTTARALVAAEGRSAAFTFNATDPAGEFTLSLRAGRAVHATVDGQVLMPPRLSQQGAAVTLNPPAPYTPFVVQIVPGGIRWDARASRGP